MPVFLPLVIQSENIFSLYFAPGCW